MSSIPSHDQLFLALQGGYNTSNCSTLLSADTVSKLGTDPSCKFQLASLLSITLGNGATIMPEGFASPDAIQLASSILQDASGEKFSTLNSQLNFIIFEVWIFFKNIRSIATGRCANKSPSNLKFPLKLHCVVNIANLAHARHTIKSLLVLQICQSTVSNIQSSLKAERSCHVI